MKEKTIMKKLDKLLEQYANAYYWEREGWEASHEKLLTDSMVEIEKFKKNIHKLYICHRKNNSTE